MRQPNHCVGVGDELRSPLRPLLYALVSILRHVRQHAICMVFHDGLRRKRQRPCEDANRIRFSRSTT
eukprot:3520988-Pleurochrysis_carterae.AAC.3